MQKDGRNGLSYDAEIEDSKLKHTETHIHTRGSVEFQTYRYLLTWKTMLFHVVSSDLIWNTYSYYN